MIRTFGTVVVLAMLSLLGATASADTWVEGTHYQKLDTPVPTVNDGKIEVAEVFWYGCPHCYNFKPLIEALGKAVAG